LLWLSVRVVVFFVAMLNSVKAVSGNLRGIGEAGLTRERARPAPNTDYRRGGVADGDTGVEALARSSSTSTSV
jgi:hypothetical protein